MFAHIPRGEFKVILNSHHAIPNPTHSVPTKENIGMQINESDIITNITLNILLILKRPPKQYIFMINNKLLATNYLPFINYNNTPEYPLHWN